MTPERALIAALPAREAAVISALVRHLGARLVDDALTVPIQWVTREEAKQMYRAVEPLTDQPTLWDAA